MKKFTLTLTAVFFAAAIFLVGAAVTQSPTPVYAAEKCPDGVTDIPAAGATECPALGNDQCPGGSFLGFPKWYKYLQSQPYNDSVTGKQTCIPKVNGLNDIWKIVAAVIELLTRLASLIAIGFVVYGGVTYILSQGNPDKTKQALKTVINSVVGLAIAIVSTALVSFVAGRF